MVKNFAWLGLAFFVAGALSGGAAPASAKVNKRTACAATRAIQLHQMTRIQEVNSIPPCPGAQETETCCGPFCK